MKQNKIVFYFPWKEVSGGPIYLTRLANALADVEGYEVYYTDYENGLSDSLLKNEKIKKITVTEKSFEINIDEPVTIITPIYWACWLPKLHDDSKILFFNWHICCIPVLKSTWKINDEELSDVLRLVNEKNSVFFCDYSHWMAQNTKDIQFEKKFVSITLDDKYSTSPVSVINDSEINLGVLGRLCDDKIYSILNLLDNYKKVETKLKKNLHVIGDGPQKFLINLKNYENINIHFHGTVTNDKLDELLKNRIDVLFAMGTSVLESAALAMPSVIIPHNMSPFFCDKYTYLHESKGYCLGWYDDQIEEIGVISRPLTEVISDIYEKKLKAELGKASYDYFKTNHAISSSIGSLQKAIESTCLNSLDFKKATSGFKSVYKSISLFGVPLLRILKGVSGNYELFVLNFGAIATAKKLDSESVWNFSIFGFHLLNLIKINGKIRLKLNVFKSNQ
jgi:hypothetical protein